MPAVFSTLWDRALLPLYRTVTVLTYPISLPFIINCYWPSTIENAQLLRRLWVSAYIPATGYFYYAMSKMEWSFYAKASAHFIWFWGVDYLGWGITAALTMTEKVIGRKESTNRLFNRPDPQFKGDKIVILGNGPSLAKGEPLGELIDGMDEVVRFNNFQTTRSGLQEFTGTKTTVHVNDGMLSASWPMYKTPDATVVLSLFMDRLIVSLQYFVFRAFIDLEPRAMWSLMGNPATGWISEEDIAACRKEIEQSVHKHPTSGCLLIYWMAKNAPKKALPIYIHGFDFFQAYQEGTGQIHYYAKTEPLYERINDAMGVNLMHEPQKERAFVDRLIQQGKVKLLKDVKK